LCPSQTCRGKKEPADDTEATTTKAKNKIYPSHFVHLLFPEGVATNVQGSVVVLQHFYGYYRRAIRDALGRSSRKPFQCGGLQGYDQLVGIDQYLSQRRLQSSPDPYLDQLQGCVQSALRATASRALGIRQARTCLIEMECHLAEASRPSLGVTEWETQGLLSGSETVQQELEQMVSDWMLQPDVRPLTRRLVRKWKSMSKSWLPGILHCYDVPGLPRSNLDLESTFGTLRRAQRRTSGRKETTPIRVFGPGQIVLLSMEDVEILPLLRSVSVDEYWSQRRRQEEREEPRRWLTRLHRDPVQALAQVDEQFYAVVNAQTGASSNIPDDP
jgi:hypothetical protein